MAIKTSSESAERERERGGGLIRLVLISHSVKTLSAVMS